MRRQLLVGLSILAVVLIAATGCRTTFPERTAASESTSVDADSAGSGSGSGAGADASTGNEVFRAASPSIVFVEAFDQFGSGVVTEDGWIVTNEHVVARLSEVRIGLADGTDLGLHPVVATDPVLDLAIVGPVDGLEPIARGDSGAMGIGDFVYLLGFPDEISALPTATLTRGVVSKRRSIAIGDFPFLQVDALIAPGQSGGALVDGEGRLVGISGLGFGSGDFGLVLESDPMWPRVDALIASAGSSVDETPVFEFEDDLGQFRYTAVLVSTDEVGSIVVEADSEADVFIELLTLSGGVYYDQLGMVDYFLGNEFDEEQSNPYTVDEYYDGVERLDVVVEPGTYQVVVGSASAGPPVPVTVSSPNPMVRLADVEDGSELPVGELVEGELGWFSDSDRWTLSLESGQNVSIIADGIADTIVVVRLDGELIASSDDEGIGLYGTGSAVEFKARASGVYEVEVGTYDTDRTGYLIEVTVN